MDFKTTTVSFKCVMKKRLSVSQEVPSDTQLANI